ncbi:hypothetical protein ACFY9Y_35100 [Streptomyces fimicarius]|uniref:hypothetical protein n=1 Tax=Streptomyces griseus TaxID=1911 RepID=UPI0036E6BBDA
MSSTDTLNTQTPSSAAPVPAVITQVVTIDGTRYWVGSGLPYGTIQTPTGGNVDEYVTEIVDGPDWVELTLSGGSILAIPAARIAHLVMRRPGS